MHAYRAQMDKATDEELLDALKNHPAIRKEVRVANGEIVDRFPPTGVVSTGPIAGPSNGRVRKPANYRKRFDICYEGCYCPRIAPAVGGPRAQKAPRLSEAPDHDSTSESDESEQ